MHGHCPLNPLCHAGFSKVACGPSCSHKPQDSAHRGFAVYRCCSPSCPSFLFVLLLFLSCTIPWSWPLPLNLPFLKMLWAGMRVFVVRKIPNFGAMEEEAPAGPLCVLRVSGQPHLQAEVAMESLRMGPLGPGCRSLSRSRPAQDQSLAACWRSYVGADRTQSQQSPRKQVREDITLPRPSVSLCAPVPVHGCSVLR